MGTQCIPQGEMGAMPQASPSLSWLQSTEEINSLQGTGREDLDPMHTV